MIVLIQEKKTIITYLKKVYKPNIKGIVFYIYFGKQEF